jgi:hypothetical protein
MNAATRKVYKEGYNETEAEIITKNGDRKLYYSEWSSVIYEGKLCLLGTGIDLTERERAQRKSKDNEKNTGRFLNRLRSHLVTDFKAEILRSEWQLVQIIRVYKKGIAAHECLFAGMPGSAHGETVAK